MNVIARLAVLLVPSMPAALFVVLVSGAIGFGGGEKDILLAIPLLLWSLVYFLCFLLFWLRRRTLMQSFSMAPAVATGAIAVICLGLTVVTLAAAH